MIANGVLIRNHIPSDRSFIRNSWCKSSYSHLSSFHWRSGQGKPPYFGVYKVLFDHVMDRICEDANLAVAYNSEDTDQLLGWCAYQKNPDILHYIQVKKELWGNGIANAILEKISISKDKPCIYTFSTTFFSLHHAPDKWQYIPHWLIKGSS